MEVIGHIQVSATLPTEKTQYPINMGLAVPQGQSGLFGEEKYFLPKFETQAVYSAG
jgi:hypothetical protein